MKYHIITILLAFAAIFPMRKTNAQSLIADTIIHIGYQDAVNGMILTNKGEAILVGKYDTDSVTPRNIWVKRLGFQNDTIVVEKWQKNYIPPLASRVSAVKWLMDSTFMIAGSWNNSCMLLNMSENGDSLGTILIPGTSDTYFKDFVELANGDFIVTQVDTEEDLYTKMMRITATGSVVWDSAYTDRYYSSLGYYNEDSILTAGYEYHQEYRHLQFGSFRPLNGLSYFNNMYQEFYGFNNCMAVDSGAVYLGNQKSYVSSAGVVSQVIRMLPDGEVDWDVDFTGIGSKTIKDIHIYDNYLLTFSEKQIPNSGQLIVGAITFDGVLADVFTLPAPNPEAVAVDTYENTMYLTGRLFNSLNGKDVFFLKFNLDSIFVISGRKEYALGKPLKLYPNPASETLHIEMTNPSGERATSVMFYSMAGRMERRFDVTPASVLQLPVGDMPGGLYVVVIHYENRSPVMEKVLILH